MYSQYLKVKPSKNGVGVFTSVEIPADVPILEIRGDLFSLNTLPDPYHPAVLQIGKDLYIGPSGDILPDHINHSCNPNCSIHTVGNRAFLYSVYLIPANSELTFDYSTTATDTMEQWTMNCRCGSFNCRKVISGYQYLSDELKREYEKKGMIPLFLRDTMFQ